MSGQTTGRWAVTGGRGVGLRRRGVIGDVDGKRRGIRSRERSIVAGATGPRRDGSSGVGDGHAKERARDAVADVVSTQTRAGAKVKVEAEETVDLVEEFRRGVMFGKSMKERFTQARIDDRGLPIADALVVISTPVLVALVVLALGIPRPSWLVPSPWVPKLRGGLPYLPPALAHGSKLALCWIPGAIAARAYEEEAYDGTVQEAVSRTVKGGCFAVGLLILLTQVTLTAKFAAMGMEPPQLGYSYETDLVLNGAASELIADAFFEAIALIGWRIIRCKAEIPKDDWY